MIRKGPLGGLYIICLWIIPVTGCKPVRPGTGGVVVPTAIRLDVLTFDGGPD